MTSTPATDATRHRSAAMFGKLLPELSACLSLLLLAIGPDAWFAPDPSAIIVMLAAEGASLMFFCTLVDIASRVKKRPPWWLAVLLVGGVLLLSPGLMSVLELAFLAGWWVFLPLAWSLLERVRELWTLPAAATQEKIRRRTLTFDRQWIALLIGGIGCVCAIGVALLSEEGIGAVARPIVGVAVGVLFYGIAAFNAWRVHQPRFTQRPTSLVPWLDRGDGTYLSPL